MKKFELFPTIEQFDNCAEFLSEYSIGKGDLVFVSEGTKRYCFPDAFQDALVINYRKYGSGEPTDAMVEAMYQEVQGHSYNRVFAIGGGTILDVAKLFALKTILPILDLYDGKLAIEKDKELILIPTTCGTGSEVTNICILELTARNTKMGLAVNALYADTAILIPELLTHLPYPFFATSSIDALIHSAESYLSPKATPFSQMYSVKAMEIILSGYQKIAHNGPEARKELLPEFLLASTYAGIAFGNAGCGAVHAMSYPLGATYHVAHGEANYVMFTEVFKTYFALKPNGKIQDLNTILASILGCPSERVYEDLENLLSHILTKKPLQEYNVTRADILSFTETVMTKQGRLMANNYTELSRDTILSIYNNLF